MDALPLPVQFFKTYVIYYGVDDAHRQCWIVFVFLTYIIFIKVLLIGWGSWGHLTLKRLQTKMLVYSNAQHLISWNKISHSFSKRVKYDKITIIQWQAGRGCRKQLKYQSLCLIRRNFKDPHLCICNVNCFTVNSFKWFTFHSFSDSVLN